MILIFSSFVVTMAFIFYGCNCNKGDIEPYFLCNGIFINFYRG